MIRQSFASKTLFPTGMRSGWKLEMMQSPSTSPITFGAARMTIDAGGNLPTAYTSRQILHAGVTLHILSFIFSLFILLLLMNYFNVFLIFRPLGKKNHHLLFDFSRRHASTRMGRLWILYQKGSTTMWSVRFKMFKPSCRNKLWMAYLSSCPHENRTRFLNR